MCLEIWVSVKLYSGPWLVRANLHPVNPTHQFVGKNNIRKKVPVKSQDFNQKEMALLKFYWYLIEISSHKQQPTFIALSAEFQ